MSPKPLKIASALLVSSALTVVSIVSAADACNPPPSRPTVPVTRPSCPPGGVTVNHPVTVNHSVTVNHPVTVNNNININKSVTVTKTININKTINIQRGGSADAAAFASAYAQAGASAQASIGNIVIYSGYNEYITVNNRIGGGGEIGAAAISTVANPGACEMQEATVIKAVHAVCVSPDGREFPASHMTEQTWVDSGFEGEVLRCIPGAHLKVSLGDVSQSDQGMAGTFASAASLECAPGEALRHFKDGMLKCVAKVAVKDCTERTNLRRWGSGDLFFSFRTKVCVPGKTTAAARELELSGMSLTGGVGDQ